jgi:hypothetical protein
MAFLRFGRMFAETSHSGQLRDTLPRRRAAMDAAARIRTKRGELQIR